MYDQDISGVHPESIRVKYTLMDLIIHHPLVAEIVVIDNNPLPNSPLPLLCAKTGKARYIPFPHPKGTSVPRNHVFEQAKYAHVACIDAHVLLAPGFFEALNAFYDEHGYDCPDLLHGPMIEEDGRRVHGTHMNDQWRAGMWGTWGWGWDSPKRWPFSPIEENGEVVYGLLDYGSHELKQPLVSFKELGLPEHLPWAGHEAKLRGLGCGPIEKPFKIPGHGMGFFACRKDAWLSSPFDPRCRGFGGEEMTTHVRFRQAGRAAWCIPGAKWWHDYERPFNNQRGGSGAPYPLTLQDRVRNYGIEFLRMGLPLKPICDHFNYSEAEVRAYAKRDQ